ncbi:MAG: AMP-binding protein [Methylorubrum populi]
MNLHLADPGTLADLPAPDVAAALRERAAGAGDRVALRFLADGRTVSQTLDFRALDRRSRALAARLQATAAPGERALIALHSGPDYVAAFFGCLYAGVVAVPSYPPELRHPHHAARLSLMIADMEPRHVLTDTANREAVEETCRATCLADVRVRILCVDTVDAAEAEGWRPAPCAPDDLAFLQYTSGSTSAPKGVEVTHANLVENLRWLQEVFAVRADDVFVSWLPLYHDMGLILGMLLPVVSGRPLVLMSPQRFLARPAAWLDAIGTHRGTISAAPDFAFRLCCDRIGPSILERLDLSSWRHVCSGAEPIRHGTLMRFAETFAPAGLTPDVLHPGYGLAEATLIATSKPRASMWRALRVSRQALAEDRVVVDEDGILLVSSGQPVRPGTLRIVDPRTLEDCPPGRVGEILLSGPCIARGYWKNAEATRTTFLRQSGETWLRTGDLGFLDADDLYVTGRRKDVIILRGQNVYPQDVEQALEAAVPALRKGRVSAFAVETRAGEGVGIAAEIGRGTRAEAEAVAAAVDGVLAEVLHEPAALVALLEPGALPKTTSGKLQRSACLPRLDSGELVPLHLYRRESAVAAGAGAAADEPPRTATERRLLGIVADLLGLDAIGRRANFLELGGHSLLAVRAVERIRAEFGVAASLRDLFAAWSLADLAARIETMPPASTALPALDRLPAGAPQRLSRAQQRLWLAERLGEEAGRAAYVMTGQIRLEGPLSSEAFAAALRAVAARHEILRTAYPEAEDGLPMVRTVPGIVLDIPVIDLSGLAPVEREARLAEAEAAEACTPFDLASAPLLRARLFRLAPESHSLVLAMHHLIGDGWSFGVLLADLGAGYRAATDGASSPHPPLPLQYGDYAVWQHRAVERIGAVETAFWRRHLDGTPHRLSLPADFPRPPVLPVSGASRRLVLPAPLVARLSALGRARGATLFMTLLAGFQALLHRLSGAERFVVGTDHAGRPLPELEGLIGFFVNVLPLRAALHDAPSFGRLVERVREDALAAFDHALLPFDRIVDALKVPRDRSRPPLVQALFVMQSAPPGDFAVAGISARLQPASAQASKFETALFLDAPSPEGTVAVEWVYATALFRPERVARWADAFVNLLEQASRSPDMPVHAIPLPSLEEPAMPDPVLPDPALPRAADRLGAKLDKLKGLKSGGAAASAPPRAPARLSALTPGGAFPLVIEPPSADIDPAAWAARERGWVEDKLRHHAGLLFRGFGIATPQEFEAFAEALHPGLYGGYGDLPKNEGGRNTYRSTPYPEREMILYHNESSHLHAWPRKQWFFCQEPSPVGGATPIVDCREMYRRLPAELAARFERLGLIYVRTFTERFDVDWRRFFHTEDRAQVEARCRAEGVDFDWLDDNTLQTRTRCPAVIVHPLTGEKSFFNQVQLHHTRCLDPDLRADLLGLVGPRRMPRDVLYGDGSPIEDAVMDELGRLYEACAVRFDWHRGDVAMLDNMLAAHARDPFEGPRRIVVAMGDMTARAAVAGVNAPNGGLR